MRFSVFFWLSFSCLIGATWASAEHAKKDERKEVTPDLNLAAVTWVLFDNRNDFRRSPENLRKIFCACSHDGISNPDCVFPIHPENFFEVARDAPLRDDSKKVSFASQVGWALEAIESADKPILHIYIDSHGDVGKLCQQDKASMPLRAVTNEIFDRVNKFVTKTKKVPRVVIYYDACYSGSLIAHVEAALRDPAGKYVGAKGAKYKFPVDVYTASALGDPGIGNDMSLNIREMADGKNKSTAFGNDKVLPFCSGGAIKTGRQQIWSSDRDIAKEAFEALAKYHPSDLPRGFDKNDGEGAKFLEDRANKRRLPATAISLVQKYFDRDKPCEMVEKIISLLDDPKWLTRFFGDGSEALSQFLAEADPDGICKLRRGNLTAWFAEQLEKDKFTGAKIFANYILHLPRFTSKQRKDELTRIFKKYEFGDDDLRLRVAEKLQSVAEAKRAIANKLGRGARSPKELRFTHSLKESFLRKETTYGALREVWEDLEKNSAKDDGTQWKRHYVAELLSRMADGSEEEKQFALKALRESSSEPDRLSDAESKFKYYSTYNPQNYRHRRSLKSCDLSFKTETVRADATSRSDYEVATMYVANNEDKRKIKSALFAHSDGEIDVFHGTAINFNSGKNLHAERFRNPTYPLSVSVTIEYVDGSSVTCYRKMERPE